MQKTVLEQLQKQLDDECAAHNETKQMYNDLRDTVLASYEEISDEPLETGDGDDDSDEADEE